MQPASATARFSTAGSISTKLVGYTKISKGARARPARQGRSFHLYLNGRDVVLDLAA